MRNAKNLYKYISFSLMRRKANFKRSLIDLNSKFSF